MNLAEAFENQRRLQEEVYHALPDTEDNEAVVEFIRTNILALEDELHEALAEVGWKPWATSRHVNREAFLGEMTDAFHFFMNLLIVTGYDGQDLLKAYEQKSMINEQRQIDGYDGISSKCPGCGRALDDPSVRCHREGGISAMFFCQDAGWGWL